MRFGLFVAAWGSVLGMSLIYIIVGGMADLSQLILARRRKVAVEKISVLLFESEAEAAAIFEEVADLPRRTLLALIQTLAVDLDGQARRRLQNLVAASGLQRFIRRRARSKRWRKRVQAAQLNYLVTHPDFDRKALVNDPHALVRARAAESFTAEQAAQHVPDLIRLLGDESLAVRIAAQRALICAGAASVNELLQHLDMGGSSSLAALEVAANLSDARLTGAIDRYTRDSDPVARTMACRALGNGVGTEGTPLLHRLLNDVEPEVKAAAIQALGQLGSQRSVVLIGAALRDRSFLVRRSAGVALDMLGAPGHLVLRRHLRDPDRYARDMARQMLDAAAARQGLDLVPSHDTIHIPVAEPVGNGLDHGFVPPPGLDELYNDNKVLVPVTIALTSSSEDFT